MKLIFVLLLLIISCVSYAVDISQNSYPNFLEKWNCEYGYYWSGQHCVEIRVPKNGRLNYIGNGWVCNRGYYRSGQKCLRIKIPKNAQLDVTGNGWICDRGYYQSGQRCLRIKIPKNAQLDVTGNDWICDRGYYQSRQKCLRIKIPKNAQLDITGNGWVCDRNFKKRGSSCVRMTKQEIKKQKEAEEAIAAEIERRRTQGVSGDDCEREYKTNAEVCVQITDRYLDCNESRDGESYRDCDAVINYMIATDYSGGVYIDTEIECSVEIEYKGNKIYSTRTEWASQDESYYLYAYARENHSMILNFFFSLYEEATSVEISSVQCEIDSVDLY